MMKPRGLKKVKEEVEKIKDKKRKPIDEKIKPLVIGLRRWGIETEMSCEGHLPPWGFPYPWVMVPVRQARKIAKIVSWQNRPKLPNGKENKNFWVLKPLGGVFRLMPENKKQKLETIQRDAIEFGQFLQDKETRKLTNR